MVNPGNVRKLNALSGKRPQATGMVLIPKNGDRKLATSNGSAANYGGNTKMGLFPSVGMSYSFQNRIGVGSLFKAQVDPGTVVPTSTTTTPTIDTTAPTIDTTAPTIDTTNLLTSISAGSQVLGSVSANESVTWSIISGGLDKSINSSTGVVTLNSGATTTSGVVDYKIRATDGNNNTTDTATISVGISNWN
ncbi:hypothetical protein OAU91_01430, partial [Flavobacteriaceae bacterium]|nr:hypothetical protein [Flavobacteriaceae bacterium]